MQLIKLSTYVLGDVEAIDRASNAATQNYSTHCLISSHSFKMPSLLCRVYCLVMLYLGVDPMTSLLWPSVLSGTCIEHTACNIDV